MEMELEQIPNFLHPRLRLFMSVDLVGSTALKQSGSFPIKAPKEGDGLRDVGAHWFFDIASFYSEIEAKFAKHWKHYCENIANKNGWPISEPPELWKSNGDELIYVKELSSAKECIVAISCWMRAAKDFRKHLRGKKSKLDVKLAAWTAGFPVTNTEVIFQSGYRKENQENSDWIPEVLHFYFLEKWHTQPEKRNDLVRDYIGPSIDTGFRIASKATPRKFSISLEIALMLAMTNVPDDIEEFNLRYDGQEVLKGVLGGRPYPMFWIDTLSDDALTLLEDGLIKNDKSNRDQIKKYCKEFIGRHDTYMLSPFIVTDAEPLLAMVPPNYEVLITHLAKEWEKAKQSHNVYLRSMKGETPEEEKGEHLNDSALDLTVNLPPAQFGSDITQIDNQ
ncbi:hypothetical protein ACIU1J_12845 [Azospirillum doebereinerae]|uniref:hypothetical protein n=1 Tax=Azospirillum doebereinerae TaxID=92933 RepID=UPI001EE4EDEE|nr:hypothetical protein [Azospirillum doebereinerae]MCG5242714.1 hypothetical protein [Azospirillum doebereinerae]